MNFSKKILGLIMASSITLFSVVGCAPATESSVSTEPESSAIESSATVEPTAEGDTRIVIDHNGDEVEIPLELNRIVISSIWPLPSVYALFDGTGENLVGMHPSSMAAAENSILPKVAPKILEASTEFVIGEELNIEELLKLKPDVVFYSANNAAEAEMLATAGIPAIGFSTSNWDYDSVETFAGWVELLGVVLEQEDKATGIADYGRSVYTQLQVDLTDIAEEDKPSALILLRYENGVIRTVGTGHFGQYWLESTGAINAASELKGSVDISMEQIYEWNPDIIYITNFSPHLAEDILENNVDDFDWTPVKAVQDGKVYKFPLGMYRWYPPASDTPLVLQWLAQKNQPELFTDVDMAQEIKDYYKRFYSVDLTDDDVDQIFNPAREAAGV